MKKQEFLERLADYGAGGELFQNGFQTNKRNNKSADEFDESTDTTILYTLLKDLETVCPTKKACYIYVLYNLNIHIVYVLYRNLIHYVFV